MDTHLLRTAQRAAALSGKASLGMHQYQLDPAGRLVFVGANPDADQLLGIDHSTLVGKTIEEIFPGLANTDIPEIYRSVAREGIPWQTDQILIEQGQISYALQIHAFQTAPGAMAVLFQDIRARQQMELSLHKRDAILSAVAFAAEQFLGSGEWKKKIREVLSRLGLATEATRFYLCENRLTPKGEIVAKRLFEWQDPTIQSALCEPWMTYFNFEANHFSRWISLLSKGEAIYGVTSHFPDPEKSLLIANRVRSIAVAPIHVNRYWWGIIGFDDCRNERVFTTAEIDALKTAANTIGAAIQRAAADARLWQSATRAQIMVKAGASLNAELESQSVAKMVSQEIVTALNAKSACVYLLNEENQLLEFAGGYPSLTQDMDPAPSVSLTTLDLHLHKWGMPLYLRESGAILQFFNAPLNKRLGARTFVIWLLLHHQKLIGMVTVAYESGTRVLEADELELLEGLCNQAALAFNNAHLYALERKRSQEITLLYQLSVNLNRSQNTQEALDCALNGVQNLLGAEASMAILPNEHKSLVAIPQANGFLSANRGLTAGLDEKWSESITKCTAPLVASDLSQISPLIANLPGMEQTGEAVVIPLLSASRPTGLLLVAQPHNVNKQFNLAHDLQYLRTIGELVGTAVQKNQFYEDAQRRLTFLQALRSIDVEIARSLDLNATLHVVLEEVISQLHVDAVDVLVADPKTKALQMQVARGFRNPELLAASLERGNHYAELAARDRRMVILSDLRNRTDHSTHAALFASEGFNAYVAMPLSSKGELKGVMEVYRHQPLEPDQEWFEFLETLAGQAAIAIENITLSHNLQQTYQELIQAYDATIEGWSTALDLKDADTKGHTQRVTQMSVRLAEELGLDPQELVHVRRGAMLHDIGKMGVPDHILRKPGPLDEEEWKIMKKHPIYAYEWLSSTTYLRPALDIPYCHHEKWDGSGYPQGLKGEKIPLKARIFSVVDVWDALSSDRPYRQRWQPEQVIGYLRDQAGHHFDPEIVPIFLNLLEDQSYPM